MPSRRVCRVSGRPAEPARFADFSHKLGSMERSSVSAGVYSGPASTSRTVVPPILSLVRRFCVNFPASWRIGARDIPKQHDDIARVGLVASVVHPKCKTGEPLWYRKGRSVGVDHRGRHAVSEPRCSIGGEGLELVEVHHAKPSQRIELAIELTTSTDPRVDGDGRREPGIDIEVHRLGRCLICQAVECSASGVGLQAQGGADSVAGANRKGDLRPGVNPNQRSYALGCIDRHFYVNVKESKAEEGTEVVRKSPQSRAVFEVWYCPGS
jgi:hypothetical protein